VTFIAAALPKKHAEHACVGLPRWNRYTKRTSCPSFRIAWIATDTSLSFNALATGAADVSITYHAYAEAIAMRQGVADRRVYGWRDHFMLVGTYR
jgi:hypothetical protein